MNSSKFILLSGLFSCLLSIGRADLSTAIQNAFADVHALRPMEGTVVYSVEVGGTRESGIGDSFLRRRPAREISSSGLSTGCGDNAFVFLDAVERQGVEARIVEGAEISYFSLLHKFSGHVVVAVRNRGSQGDWTLVDSTSLKILSGHWSGSEKSFDDYGSKFWIGYFGTLQDYPVCGPEDLRRFYTTTLAKVPVAELSACFVRMTFKIDSSLASDEESGIVDRIREMSKMEDKILQQNSISPGLSIEVVLKRGGDDARGDLKHIEGEGWVSNLGIRSACSPSLLDYYRRIIMESRTSRQDPRQNGLSPAPPGHD